MKCVRMAKCHGYGQLCLWLWLSTAVYDYAYNAMPMPITMTMPMAIPMTMPMPMPMPMALPMTMPTLAMAGLTSRRLSTKIHNLPQLTARRHRLHSMFAELTHK